MKYDNTLRLIAVFFPAITLSLAGCGGTRIPGLATGEGTVIWKGEPVEGAFVAFSPKNNLNGRSAFGTTDVKGRFKTTTLDDNDGILPGEYWVTITKIEEVREGGPEADADDPEKNRGKNVSKPTPEKITQTHFIPPIYANKETSGLSAVIPSKGERNLKFELVGETASPPTR